MRKVCDRVRMVCVDFELGPRADADDAFGKATAETGTLVYCKDRCGEPTKSCSLEP